MNQPSLPYPPLELANRVGSLEGSEDPWKLYDDIGRCSREDIVRRLPANWTFQGKRILDFGCGAGRTLRHFAPEASEAEVWGCDIDEASISWMEENQCPPFHVFANGAEPPLPHPAESFDLIWAVSVFTHLTDNWSRWLLELHRVLTKDGLLFATFMGSAMSEVIAGEPWEETRCGMNVLKYGQSWNLGGPMVLHSPWWIEEHWGRAFEIISLAPDGFPGASSEGHGSVLMRKRDSSITPDILETLDPTEMRETSALAHGVRQLLDECSELRRERDYLSSELALAREQMLQHERQLSDLARRLETIEQSKSWRVTRPLRNVAAQVRAARR
ncbi:MAG: methyltransferase domain-containing protein [Solirubrobacteraceae bacterium]